MAAIMGPTILLAGLMFLMQNGCFLAEVRPPPKISGSYMAAGEMVENLNVTDQFEITSNGYPMAADDKLEVDTFQARFEETFDAGSGNAAFTFYEIGFNMTFIEDATVKQTFAFVNGECQLTTAEEWASTDAPPSLMGYKSKNGTVRFALRQLFQLNENKSVPSKAGTSYVYRDVPAEYWVYDLTDPLQKGENKTTVNVYAYWSKKNVSTTSRPGLQIPLGFRIMKFVKDKSDKKIHTSNQYINVFSFVHDAVDRKAFEPKEGIHCPDRKPSFPFPKLSTSKNLSFRTEVVLPDYQEIKYTDVSYDTANGFLKITLDRMEGQDPTSKTKRYTSNIISKKLGTNGFVFPFNVYKGVVTCEPYDVQQYKMEQQEIVNPKLDLKFWGLDYLLGRNTTNYVYVGKTVKRSIPCHIFQGKRTDWPDDTSKTVSVWDWCIAGNVTGSDTESIKFRDDEIGIINAQVNIISSQNKDYIDKLIFHFHDFLGEEPLNPTTGYDLSRCFRRTNSMMLEFIVDLPLTEDNIDGVKNATNDVAFIKKWHLAILEKANLKPESLRVSRLFSTVFNNQLYVNFILLGSHPALKDIETVTLDSAFNSLKIAADKGELKIEHEFAKGKGKTTLKALKGSLSEVIGEKTPLEPTALPPITQTPRVTSGTRRTLIPFTLETPGSTSGKTDGDDITTSSPELVKEVRFEGHTAGTVAGVSIAMILIGMTAGAGGTFYKYRGMPRF